MIEIILVMLFTLLIAIEWGAAENRLFAEKMTGSLILNHFKQYHIFMGLLFCTINAIAPVVIFGLFSTQGFLLWIWLLIWDILILDVVWWIIRYYDFKRDYEKAKKQYGEPNAWHLQTDWDNFGKLPIYKMYVWWYIFAVALVVIGIIIGVLSWETVIIADATSL